MSNRRPNLRGYHTLDRASAASIEAIHRSRELLVRTAGLVETKLISARVQIEAAKPEHGEHN